MSQYLRKRSQLTGGEANGGLPAIPATLPLEHGTELVYVRITGTVDLHSVQTKRPWRGRRDVWAKLGQMVSALSMRLTRLDRDDGEHVPEMVPVSLSGPRECVQECLDALARAGYPFAQIAPSSRGKDGGRVSHGECSIPRIGAGLTGGEVKKPKSVAKSDCTGARNALLGLIPRPLDPLPSIPGNPPKPPRWYGGDARANEIGELLREVSQANLITTGTLPPDADATVAREDGTPNLARLMTGSVAWYWYQYDLAYLAHYAV